jgi:hypothetical protein
MMSDEMEEEASLNDVYGDMIPVLEQTSGLVKGGRSVFE